MRWEDKDAIFDIGVLIAMARTGDGDVHLGWEEVSMDDTRALLSSGRTMLSANVDNGKLDI